MPLNKDIIDDFTKAGGKQHLTEEDQAYHEKVSEADIKKWRARAWEAFGRMADDWKRGKGIPADMKKGLFDKVLGGNTRSVRAAFHRIIDDDLVPYFEKMRRKHEKDFKESLRELGEMAKD